eukprot:6186361-Pleurochrysis_carterae.AAC.2
MELTRSNLTAAAAPASFWDYAAEHAVDVLNRTSGPPGAQSSSYQLLTAETSRRSCQSCPSVVAPSLLSLESPFQKPGSNRARW